MAAMAAAGWVAEVPQAVDNPRKGVDLARCIIQHGLWDAGTNQAVLLDTSAFAPGVYSMLPGASTLSICVAWDGEARGASRLAIGRYAIRRFLIFVFVA